MYVTIVISYILLSSHYSWGSKPPGLQLRITQKGIDFANAYAIAKITRELRGKTIPDQHGTARVAVGKVEYSLTGIRVDSFSTPNSRIQVQPDNGLKWTVSGGGCVLKADWRYKYRLGFIKISDHGTFDVTANGINLDTLVELGDSADGHPTIHSTYLTAFVSKLDVKFHGGASWLYNLFKGSVANTIKSKLNDLLHKEALKAINVDAMKSLAKMKVLTNLGRDFLLDYRLIKKPSFSKDYLQSYHKGEILWAAPQTEYPFDAPLFSLEPTDSKMATLWMSDYVMNSFGYQCFSHGVLSYHLTKKDIPKEVPGLLNTTCTGTCIGKFVKEVAKLYPGATFQVNMKATRQPVMNATTSGIKGNLIGTMMFDVMLPSGAVVQDVFTLQIELDLDVDAVLKDYLLMAQSKMKSFNITIVQSKVGKINPIGLKFVLNYIMKDFVVGKLNELGAKGLPIMKLDEFYLVNPSLQLGQHVLLITSDISLTKPKQHDDNKLYFVGHSDVDW